MAASSLGVALALGCSPVARPTNEIDEPSGDPTATPTSGTTVSATSTATVATATATVAQAALPVPPGCTPEVYCRPPRTPVESSGTGPPPDPNAVDTTVYDKDGCVARDDVGHTCNGIRALDGPTVNGGQCCYSICRFPVPCGRPLVVDGAPRLAPTRSRDDWAASPKEGRGARSTTDASLEREWLRDAAMEHASVASFASLSLSLLSLGAPARLIEGAHRAALDEIEHARLCYALATGDAPVGPGAIDLSRVRIATTISELAVATVRDGCVGETIAALAAAAALERCRDEGVRAALARIAADELTHAELAFAIVGWAIAVGGDVVRAAVASAAAEGLDWSAGLDAPEVEGDAAWRAAGRLDRAALHLVKVEAREEVLRPSFAHLLALRGAAIHPPAC